MRFEGHKSKQLTNDCQTCFRITVEEKQLIFKELQTDIFAFSKISNNTNIERVSYSNASCNFVTVYSARPCNI